ncbi:phage head-tail connector protein [Aureimonas sp. N4]|uniref:phage head-tail connector protein n=1 Tax=Aureimonas sp. N4 TaxID=1638165 RepID=UPI0007817A83|nr:phage head-tail connector protein [Aureimonas sp. N4]
MRPPVRIVAPAVLPVTIEEVRDACRITGSSEDARLQRMAQAAVERLDGYRGRLGRALIHQTWRQDFGIGECAPLRLRFPDAVSATGLWLDLDGTETAAAIRLDEDVVSPFVVANRNGGPAGRLLRVTYVAGYGPTAADVPAAIREAILLDIGHRFHATSEGGQIRSETTEDVGSIAFNSPEQTALARKRMIDDLLRDFRRWNV